MADNDQVLGQILGELKGIRAVMDANHAATQQRFNDFANANETRFKGVETRLAKVESNPTTLLLRAGAGGGISGGLVAAAIELVRMGMKLGG